MDNKKYLDKENYFTVGASTAVWRRHLNAKFIYQTISFMGDKIADLGCNHGACTILMAEYGVPVVGFDINSGAIKVAYGLVSEADLYVRKTIEFRNCSFDKLTASDGEFSGIYMLDVFEHIYPEDREEIFNEIKRVLGDGGKIGMVVPFGDTCPDKCHVDTFDEEKIKTIIGFLNFKIIFLKRITETNTFGIFGDRIYCLMEKVDAGFNR